MLAVGGRAALPLAAHGAVAARAGRAGVGGVVPGVPVGSLSALVQAACRGRRDTRGRSATQTRSR